MVTRVLITQQANDRVVARTLAAPEVVASGRTEEEAIGRLRDALAALLDQSRIVEVDLPAVARHEPNPWLAAAGMWADDPDWEAFQDALVAARQGGDSTAETV
jgi:predicted RNase H-like HicB family nuclease